MAAKKRQFDKAYEELQQIVQKLQADNVSIDHLTAHMVRARELVQHCEAALRGVEAELTSLLREDEKKPAEEK